MSLIDKMLIEKGIKCVKLHCVQKHGPSGSTTAGAYVESTTNDKGIRALMVKEHGQDWGQA